MKCLACLGTVTGKWTCAGAKPPCVPDLTVKQPDPPTRPAP
jgi:hypothetical protein